MLPTVNLHHENQRTLARVKCISWDDRQFLSLSPQIFNCILSLRSNDLGQVGYLDKDRPIKFSPFFVCFSPDSFSSAGAPLPLSSSPSMAAGGGRGAAKSLLSPTLLDLHSTFTAVLACLEKVGEHGESSSSLI